MILSGRDSETKRARTATKPKTRSSNSKSKSRTSRPSAVEPKDRITLSSKARGSKPPKKEKSGGIVGKFRKIASDPKIKAKQDARREEETKHLGNFDENFAVFDNPGGGKTDGAVSKKDLEKVAKGEYNKDKAEQKLRDAGVPEKDISKELESLEGTAGYLLENDGFRDRLDKANDGDNKTDGKIGRGDVDKILVGVEKENREAKLAELEEKASKPPSEAHIKEAQGALDRWTEPGALEKELEERPLSEFSEAEFDALAAVNENNPEAKKKIEEAVLSSVDKADSLDELPQGDSYSFLLQSHVTGKEVKGTDQQKATNPTAVAQRQIDALVKDELEITLDERLKDRRGDGELDLALDRFGGNVEDLAIDNPALIDSITRQTEAVVEENSDEFTSVARRDDNFLQKANHAVTGGLRSGVGFVADRFRDAVSISAKITTAPLRLAGHATNFALDNAGKLAGAGLDAVGADGAADNVRAASDKAGDLAQGGASFLADQNENFTNGLGESVAGAVEGVTYAVTDPWGTVKGVANVVKDPSLLLEGYKQTYEDHGAAGVAGQAVGDVALTIFTGGGGAAAKGSSIAGRVASKLGKGGQVARTLGRGAGRTQSLLDDYGRVSGAARHGARSSVRNAVGALDNLPGVKATRTRLGNFANESATFGRVSNGARRIREGIRGDDAGAFSRRSQAVRNANPRLLDNIDSARTELGRLSKLDNLAASDLVGFIDDNLDLARRIDDVSTGKKPLGVGDTVVQGRENILKHLRENIDTLDLDQVRRLTRGVLADSDPAGPVFLTRLGKNDQVFRAFDAAGNADGGYFGRAADRGLSSRQQQANNALPTDNAANRGVLLTPGEELTIVSRVASQVDNPKFTDLARGGGWQLQFLEPSAIRAALKEIGDHAPTPKMSVFSPMVHTPGRIGRHSVEAPSVANPALMENEEPEQT